LAVGSATTGSGGNSGYAFAVVRYNANGSQDKSFDKDGKLTTTFGKGVDGFATSLVVQPNGRILVAGYRDNPDTGTALVAVHYNTDGSLDTTFGSGGKAIVSFAGSVGEEVRGIALQADGKIVLAGRAWTTTTDHWDTALARLNSNGALDPSFGSGG